MTDADAATPEETCAAFSPGRVNLIGEHTDHSGGYALPMAVHLGTTVVVRRGGHRVRLRSADRGQPADLPLRVGEPAETEPSWARYVAGVVASVRPRTGVEGRVTTTLPIGAGLASSAALEVALALALGFRGSARELALACQRAEQLASGVPCGVMDQLACASGVAGHALLIDCATNHVEAVPLPEGAEVVAVHSGESRDLAGSAYGERRAQCEAASAVLGPLRDALPGDLVALRDPVIRRRARHVVGENARVLDFVAALRRGDLREAGRLMGDSHRSLRDDFEVSTPALDELVATLTATPGVHGARLTGAGFGGCAVVLCEPGSLTVGWSLRAVDGARRLT